MNQAKQKAFDLVYQFMPYCGWVRDDVNNINLSTNIKNSIKSSLICVQEIKNNLPIKISEIREFWDEVENELNTMK